MTMPTCSRRYAAMGASRFASSRRSPGAIIHAPLKKWHRRMARAYRLLYAPPVERRATDATRGAMMERLADLFTTTGALADTNGDGYADDIALRFVAPGAPTAWEWCALADLAAVLGLHVTGFSPPLVADAWDGPTLLLDPHNDPALAAGAGRVVLEGGTMTVRGGDATGRATILRALAQGSLPDAA